MEQVIDAASEAYRPSIVTCQVCRAAWLRELQLLCERSLSSKVKILLVDDNPLLLELLTQFLKRAGFTVVACVGFREARDVLEKHVFDLVISDWDMPEGGGRALVEFMQGRPTVAPFVIITGAPEALPAEITLAAAAVVPKPSMYGPLREFLERFSARAIPPSP